MMAKLLPLVNSVDEEEFDLELIFRLMTADKPFALAQKHTLLVPVYKTAERIFAEEEDPQKYPVSREDFDITSQFYGFLGDKIALAKYDCEVKILRKAKESFSKKEQYYDFSESRSLSEPELILG